MYRIPSGKGWLRDGVASRGARLYLCVMASYQPAIPSQLPRVLNTYSELFLRLGYPQVRSAIAKFQTPLHTMPHEDAEFIHKQSSKAERRSSNRHARRRKARPPNHPIEGKPRVSKSGLTSRNSSLPPAHLRSLTRTNASVTPSESPHLGVADGQSQRAALQRIADIDLLILQSQQSQTASQEDQNSLLPSSPLSSVRYTTCSPANGLATEASDAQRPYSASTNSEEYNFPAHMLAQLDSLSDGPQRRWVALPGLTAREHTQRWDERWQAREEEK